MLFASLFCINGVYILGRRNIMFYMFALTRLVAVSLYNNMAFQPLIFIRIYVLFLKPLFLHNF